MLMRSGFFTRPRPLVEFDCGSQSTRSVLTSAAASEAARLMAVVVLPTPPFWLATAMTRPMILFLCVAGQDMRSDLRNQCQILVQLRRSVPRETSGYISRFRGRENFNPALGVSCETVLDFTYGMKNQGVLNFAIGEVFHVEHFWAIRIIMRL